MSRTATIRGLLRPHADGHGTNELHVTEIGEWSAKAVPCIQEVFRSSDVIPENTRQPTRKELLGMSLIVLFVCAVIAIALVGPLQPN